MRSAVFFLLLFFDFRGFARKPSQIVELGSAYLARTHHGDISNLGRMEREATFYAYAERKPTHRKRFAHAAVFLGVHYAREGLDSLRAAVDNTIAHLYGIAYVEYGNVLLHILGFDLFDESHFRLYLLFAKRSFPVSGRGTPEVF